MPLILIAALVVSALAVLVFAIWQKTKKSNNVEMSQSSFRSVAGFNGNFPYEQSDPSNPPKGFGKIESVEVKIKK
jgi:hypothetical protein